MSILSELAKTNSNHLCAYSLLKSCLFKLEIFSLIFFSKTIAEIQLIEKIGSSCLNTEALSLYLILQQFHLEKLELTLISFSLPLPK